MRLLQIGLGIRGTQWAEIIKDYPDATVVAFVDRDAAALDHVRKVPGHDGAEFFVDLEEALKRVEADAALIATPSRLHAEHAKQALGAGLSVMVEKPLALDVATGLEVLRQSRATDQSIMVADNYRYWPAERTVRALIEEGRIGRLDSATLVDRRNMPSQTEGPWLAEIEYPQLQEIAIHHFDSLRYLFGEQPVGISVRVWNPPWSDYRHGANTEAMIDFETLRVSYLGTMRSHSFSFSLWIEGELGCIWTNRKYVFWRPVGSRFFRPVRLVKVPAGDGERYPRGGTTSLLDSLREATARRLVPETVGEDSIWNVAMVEAGKLSDAEERSVRMDEVLRGDTLTVDADRVDHSQ